MLNFLIVSIFTATYSLFRELSSFPPTLQLSFYFCAVKGVMDLVQSSVGAIVYTAVCIHYRPIYLSIVRVSSRRMSVHGVPVSSWNPTFRG